MAAVLALAGLLATAGQAGPARAATAGTEHAAAVTGTGSAKPTIVLVHGAWADSGSWNAVTGLLQRAGYTVYAPPNPLEGLPIDTATSSAQPTTSSHRPSSYSWPTGHTPTSPRSTPPTCQ